MTLILSNQSGLSMTSQEIADLVESRHDDVKRSIERLAERGVIVQPPMADEPGADRMGRPRTTKVYVFTGEQGKRDSIIVVAQLSPEFTARLVDRWQELERGQAAIPQSLPEALRLAADLAEHNQALAVERDEAIRTKAQIGSKHEASAMAAASAAKRETKALMEKLGQGKHHATIIAVEQATKTKYPRNAYVGLRRWCRANSVSQIKVFDERYGEASAWPAGAWMDVYGVDIAALFGVA